MTTRTAVACYLAAIVTANLLAAAYGPRVTILNAFVFIGLDLILRDHLHDSWRGRGLAPRMSALILAGSALAWAINPAAGRIGIASAIAFGAAMTADASVYHLLRDRPWMQRANVSNIAGATTDSLLFPTIAFGGFLPWITLGHIAAKLAGGFLWSAVIGRARKRRTAEVMS